MVYDFFIECCDSEEDITKLLNQIYSFVEKNIDTMGSKVNKIKSLLVKYLNFKR